MWISAKKLEKLISGGESVLSLKTKIQKLKDELESLKTTKKMEQREIEHLVKLKEEKLEIDHQKTELGLQKTYQEKEMGLQTEYHKKIMAALEKGSAEMKEVYTKIMERLPNITAALEIKKRSK